MNNYILDLIDEAVNGDKESNVNKLYRMVWINILEQFKKNPINYDIFLWVKEKNNDYYNLIYYNDGKLNEILFKMTNQERAELKDMLLNDGFTINDSIIRISRGKIISFASDNNQEKASIVTAVHETDTFTTDKIKYQKH